MLRTEIRRRVRSPAEAVTNPRATVTAAATAKMYCGRVPRCFKCLRETTVREGDGGPHGPPLRKVESGRRGSGRAPRTVVALKFSNTILCGREDFAGHGIPRRRAPRPTRPAARLDPSAARLLD
eukprot:350866-Chlamydomonas_euryale.AAC.1